MGGRTPTPWTPDRLVELRRRTYEGESVTVIAAAMGVTRDTVRAGLDQPTGPKYKLSSWTPERDDVLKTMHAKGDSFGAVAAVLGITRSAAIGRASRIGLTRSEAFNVANRVAVAQRNVVFAADAKRKAFAARPVPPAKEAKPKPAVIIAGGNVIERTADALAIRTKFRCIPATAASIADLGHFQCRMPVGDLMALNGPDQLFCGAPGYPYCQEHRAIAYAAPKKIGKDYVNLQRYGR